MTHIKLPYQHPAVRIITASTSLLTASNGITGKKPLVLHENIVTNQKNWQIDFNLQKYTIQEGNASEGRAKATDLWDSEE